MPVHHNSDLSGGAQPLETPVCQGARSRSGSFEMTGCGMTKRSRHKVLRISDPEMLHLQVRSNPCRVRAIKNRGSLESQPQSKQDHETPKK